MRQKEKQQQQKHSCPIPACGAQVAPQHLMCFRHWRLVPLKLQMAVTINQRGGFGKDTFAYADAARAAIRAAAERVVWPCAFCGRTRPGAVMERLTKTATMNGLDDRTLEIRYCTDTRGCCTEASAWAASPTKETPSVGV